MTQLRCCDCGDAFEGLSEEDAGTDEAQCERCHANECAACFFDELQAQFTYRAHDEEEE